MSDIMPIQSSWSKCQPNQPRFLYRFQTTLKSVIKPVPVFQVTTKKIWINESSRRFDVERSKIWGITSLLHWKRKDRTKIISQPIWRLSIAKTWKSKRKSHPKEEKDEPTTYEAIMLNSEMNCQSLKTKTQIASKRR